MDRIKRVYVKLHLFLFAFFVVMMAVFSLGDDTEILTYIAFCCAIAVVGWLCFYLLLFHFLKKLFS